MKKYLLIGLSILVVFLAVVGIYMFTSKTSEKAPEKKVVEKEVLEDKPLISNDIKGKILFILTSEEKLGETDKKTGIWLSELTHPYYEFIANNYEADVASVKGGRAPIDSKSIDVSDAANKKFIYGKKALIENTISIEDVDIKEYKAIYFVGGHGTMWDFPNNPKIQEITRDIYENNGVIGAVCHGPSALVNVKLSDGTYLIDGKRITSFSNSEEKALKLETVVPFSLEDKIIDMGASYSRGEDWAEYVVADQRIITGQNPASAKQVARVIINLINK